jgi:hydroxymethylpyrimidine pyrophosphatase-like HAD family hydrolase
VHGLLEEHGMGDVRLVDNGITGRRSEALAPGVLHTYHLIPRAAGKAPAVAAHMRRRGFRSEETIAIGDSRGDLEVAGVVGRFYLVVNALAKDPAVREATPPGAEVMVTDEPMTAGFYEAVVRSLTDS